MARWGSSDSRGQEPRVRESAMKPVGKPDARNGHVRFDERGRETGRPPVRLLGTAPFLDSTDHAGCSLTGRTSGLPLIYTAKLWCDELKAFDRYMALETELPP